MSEVLVLTGAGASADAGLPTSVQLTQQIDGMLRGDARSVYRYVVGGLMMARGARGYSPLDAINVEEVFSAVELLSARSSLEISPFVGSWHSGVTALEMDADRLYKALYRGITEDFARGSRFGHAPSDVGRALAPLLGRTHSYEGTGVFKLTAVQMIEALVKCLEVKNAEAVDYLVPLLQFASDHDSSICTLNYDTAVEVAAHAAGLECSTGLTEWNTTGRFDRPSGLELLKLHGSITWHTGRVANRHESSPIHESKWDGPIPNTNAERQLLFGQREKLRVDGPFLDLLLTFRERLAAARCLVVVGYSFGDAHVNHYIQQWARTTARPHIIVISPEPHSWPQAGSRHARPLLPDSPDLVTHIQKRAREGIALVPDALSQWTCARDQEDVCTCANCGREVSAALESCFWCGRSL